MESRSRERDLGVLAERKLNVSQHCILAAKRANWCIRAEEQGIQGAAEVPGCAQHRAEEVRRGLMASAAPHTGSRGQY